MAPAPSALRRDLQGHMNPRILRANQQGLCLLRLLPEKGLGREKDGVCDWQNLGDIQTSLSF